MNEPLSYRLFRDAGVPAGRTAYAQVYLTVPDQHTNHYVGVYSIVENVDNNFTRSRFGTKRGALFQAGDPPGVRRPGGQLVRLPAELWRQDSCVRRGGETRHRLQQAGVARERHGVRGAAGRSFSTSTSSRASWP